MIVSSRQQRPLKIKIAQLLRALCAAVAVISLSLYLWRLEWTILEFVGFIASVIALWFPAALIVYQTTGNIVQPVSVRLILSICASYGVTTPVYYGLRLLRLEIAFFALIAIINAGFLLRLWLRRGELRFEAIRRQVSIDWGLVCIVALSLLVNLDYQVGFERDKQGNDQFALFADHVYHTGLVYELERHTPPLQSPNRAGSPERAYHIFPHVTTLLIRIVSQQSDALRVHLIYHYFVMQVLSIMLFYAMGRLLTQRRSGGYLFASLLYLLVFPMPPLLSQSLDVPLLYFTLFPYYSSSLNLVISTSPQMLSGLIVGYSAMLALIVLSIRLCRGETWGVLSVLTAVLIAASMRFRIHIFLAFAPAFGLLMLYLLIRKRQVQPLIAIFLLGALSAGFYLETLLPSYLPSTSTLTIGYNGLTSTDNLTTKIGFLQYWPGSSAVRDWLWSVGLTPPLRDWLWQVWSMIAFTLFVVIGVPWLILVFVFARSRVARREFSIFGWFVLAVVSFAILVGIIVRLDYDSY